VPALSPLPPTLPGPLATLRQINAELESVLAHLQPQRTRCSALSPQDFSAILAHIQRAAEALQHPHSDPQAAAALALEARAFRTRLHQFSKFLPALHVLLVAEKSRLETARAHLATAAVWNRERKKLL